MSGEARPDRISKLVAEEVLRVIYGDDFAGCPVGLDQIAVIIHDAMEQRAGQDQKFLEVYDQVIGSLHQLSTPPVPEQVPGPEELRAILGERLDAIHAITTKTINTTAMVRAQRGETPEN